MTSQGLQDDSTGCEQPAWRHLLERPEPAHPRPHIHLVGIGGAGLSAIAKLLLGRGFQVSGSDLHSNRATAELAALGATIHAGHSAGHVEAADLVLVSSAVPGTNPEVRAAQAAGIPVVKRAQLLRSLMAGHVSICVAGTHGKTTTSAMLATLLDAAGAEPSFIVGSEILALGTGARAGRPDGPFVVEADEYDRTFLGLRPDIAVITNVEWDHVDCYPEPASFERAFENFVDLVPRDGVIIYCGDDPGAQRLARRRALNQPTWISYGLGESRGWQARSLSWRPEGGMDFILVRDGREVGPVSLPLSGEHNVLNLLGALAAAEQAGYVFTEPAENLKISRKLAGTARRLEHKGETCGIIVLDDYAHHPTEVRATLSAVRQRYPRRPVWVLFQPHTYSRTRALLYEFCNSFENADHVLVTDIYAARERDAMGVSSTDLVKSLSEHPDARYVGDLDAATRVLLSELTAGDVLVTLGAGDGNLVGERVLAVLGRQDTSRFRPFEDRLEDLVERVGQAAGLVCKRNVSLAPHTTLRIGGPADVLVGVTAVEHLVAVCRLARQAEIPVCMIGGGSNVLVSDRGIRGLVIINRCRFVRRHEDNVVWAESGASLAGLARQTVRWGLTGLEWGASVPGTVGGAVVNNAGAHGGCVADNLLRATVLLPDSSLAEWPAPRFRYEYRSSALKSALREGAEAPVVLSAAFRLTAGEATEVEARAATFLSYRRATQPVEPSAGSVFQNPEGDYAGRLLDIMGFKGRRHGGAGFSTVHANFIVNHGDASSDDVVALIDEARSEAWHLMGVELVPEILFLGDWDRFPPYGPLPDACPASRPEDVA